jgi:hypothetical protein
MRRRLARTVGTEQTEAFTGNQMKRYPVDGRGAAEFFPQLGNFDYEPLVFAHSIKSALRFLFLPACKAQ